MIEGDTFLWMKSGLILGGKHIAANLIMVSAKYVLLLILIVNVQATQAMRYPLSMLKGKKHTSSSAAHQFTGMVMNDCNFS